MKALLAVVTVILIAVAPAHAAKADFRSLIALCLAFETSGLPIPSPGPAPAPKPGDTCPNCRGTGKVGDGTVSVTCQACGGTGKVKAKDDPLADAYYAAVHEAKAKHRSLIVWVDAKTNTDRFPDAIHVQVSGPWHDVAGPAYVESYYQAGELYWRRTVQLRSQSAAPQTSNFKARILSTILIGDPST